MKQFKILLFMCIFIFTFGFAGCSKSDMSYAAKILPPENHNMPLDGVWVTDKYYTGPSYAMNNNEIKDKIGKTVSFSENQVALYGDICESPKYKIKTVNTQNYFVGNYSINPKTLDINKTEVQVVTITSNENFFASFVILDKAKIMTYIDGVFFRLSKNTQLSSADTNLNKLLNDDKETANKSEKHSKVIKDSTNPLSKSEILQQFNSGILLGLKSYKTVSYKLPYSSSNKPIKEPVYRTLWINFSGDSVMSVNELPFILAPRKNGFWKIDTKREVHANWVKDYIFPYPLEKPIELKPGAGTIKKDGQFHNLADITFIGNDYISLALNGSGRYKDSSEPYKYDLLQVQPLDTLNLDNFSAISLDKIMGKQGLKALKQGAATYLNSLNYEDKQKLETTPRPDSFGVVRKNGKWILRGRLNYSSKAYKESFGDFDIPIIASKELVTYDSLCPNWNVIKQKVPDALDAYSPPNKNFVMILTSSKIYIYDIVNDNLSPKPIKTIALKDNETVIMSHWALGKYVKTWDDQVKSLIK